MTEPYKSEQITGSPTSKGVLDAMLFDSGHAKTELEHYAKDIIDSLREQLVVHKKMFFESCEDRNRLIEINSDLTKTILYSERVLIELRASKIMKERKENNDRSE